MQAMKAMKVIKAMKAMKGMQANHNIRGYYSNVTPLNILFWIPKQTPANTMHGVSNLCFFHECEIADGSYPPPHPREGVKLSESPPYPLPIIVIPKQRRIGNDRYLQPGMLEMVNHGVIHG